LDYEEPLPHGAMNGTKKEWEVEVNGGERRKY
jgi:hypothetical protein